MKCAIFKLMGNLSFSIHTGDFIVAHSFYKLASAYHYIDVTDRSSQENTQKEVMTWVEPLNAMATLWQPECLTEVIDRKRTCVGKVQRSLAQH